MGLGMSGRLPNYCVRAQLICSKAFCASRKALIFVRLKISLAFFPCTI